MTPSVGRTVHYVSYGTPGGEYKPACRAAIITEVHPIGPEREGMVESDYNVAVAVLNPTGMFFNVRVPYAPKEGPLDFSGGSWHWPERVD